MTHRTDGLRNKSNADEIDFWFVVFFCSEENESESTKKTKKKQICFLDDGFDDEIN